MTEHSDAPFLRHMLDAIERLEDYLTEVDWDQFEGDPILQDAVIRQLEILGEAAGRVSREFTARHRAIPWREVTGIRHKLIHDYFVVDLEIVWQTATADVPGLKPEVEKAISSFE